MKSIRKIINNQIFAYFLSTLLIILTITSGLSLAGSPALSASAAESEYEATKSVLLKTAMGTPGKAGYYSTEFYTALSYSDRWLTSCNKSEYNSGLAKFASILSSYIYGGVSCMADSPDYSSDKTALLAAYGFEDTTLYSISNIEGEGLTVQDSESVVSVLPEAETDTADATTVIIGHRNVEVDGIANDIYVVVVRGTTGAVEWQSNFDVGCDTPEYFEKTGEHPEWTDHSNHKGMDVVANRLKNLLDSYVEQHHNDSSTLSYMVTGHSRGAGIANLLGAKLETAGYNSCAYTFASPGTTTAADSLSATTVFNIINSNDFITALPLAEWGFTRYGTDISVDVANTPTVREIIEDALGATYYGKDPAFLTEHFANLASSREELYIDDECLCLYDTMEEKNAAYKATGEAIEYLHLGDFISIEDSNALNSDGKFYFTEKLSTGALMIGLSRIMSFSTDYSEMFSTIRHLGNVYPKDSKYEAALTGYITSLTGNLIESFYPHMTTCYYAIVEGTEASLNNTSAENISQVSDLQVAVGNNSVAPSPNATDTETP